MKSKQSVDSSAVLLTFAQQYTVFGPCADIEPTPSPADFIACPATLRLGGQELAPRKVKPSDCGINLGKILGGYRDRLGAWVYIPLTAPKAGRYHIGLGADWWLEAYLDGKPLKSTLEGGNGKNPPSRLDHVVEAELAAGFHLLTVRVIGGASGWMLDAGPRRTMLTTLSVRMTP